MEATVLLSLYGIYAITNMKQTALKLVLGLRLVSDVSKIWGHKKG